MFSNSTTSFRFPHHDLSTMADREDSNLKQVISCQQEQTSTGDVVFDKELGIGGEIAADRVAKRVKPVCHLILCPSIDIVQLPRLKAYCKFLYGRAFLTIWYTTMCVHIPPSTCIL